MWHIFYHGLWISTCRRYAILERGGKKDTKTPNQNQTTTKHPTLCQIMWKFEKKMGVKSLSLADFLHETSWR